MKRVYWIYALAALFYAFGVWLHIPYGGGHVYSDLVTVFQIRECPSGCTLPIPYVQAFVEYPVLSSMFLYCMGVLGSLFPGDLLYNYYYLTSLFLAIPTFLLIREVLKILKMKAMNESRVLWYVILTPSFLFMFLLNWYVIGVYFATFGMRKYLEGSHIRSGLLFGLSAAANLVTALPILGLLLVAHERKAIARLLGSALATYGVVNAPLILLNPSTWLQPWLYASNFYIEGSWMLAFLPNLSPLRHYIPIMMFGALFLAVLLTARKTSSPDPLKISWMLTFSFLFSTFIFTPQMNLILLPFFALQGVTGRYWEFLIFDTINSLVIILGFSQILFVVGITYSFVAFGPTSIVQWLAITRSAWTGKMAIYDGIYKLRFRKIKSERSSQMGQPSPRLGGSLEPTTPSGFLDWTRPRLRLKLHQMPRSLDR